MARLVGLDLGSYSVKALVIESTLRGSAVKQFVEIPLFKEGEKLERLRAALASLQLGPFDTAVTAMPGATLATHILSMPFNDPKKLEATLGFEIEGQLPFELSDAVYDYQVVGTEEGGGATVLAGVVKREELLPLLDVLKATKTDPKIVTHAGLAYQNLLAAMPALPAADGPEPAVAIIDLGHERISLAVGRGGGTVEMTRSFPGGGLALTKTLAKDFNISLDDAQAWKEKHGAVGSEAVGADAERAAESFLKALRPVFRELRPTLKAYTARARRPIGKVVLCGGTARLRGLAEVFERELGWPAMVAQLPADAAAVVGEAGPAAYQAYALAQRAQASGAKAPRFNLRRGELAFKSDFDFVQERTGQLAALAVVLLVLLVSSGIVRNAVLERRVKQLDAMLCDVTQRVLGKCERDIERALNMMKGQESPAAGIPKLSAALLLAELTQRVPPDMKVTFEAMTIDLDRMKLKAEADSTKTIEDLMSSMKNYKCFKEITQGKLEKNKDGTKVTVGLDVEVECPEDAAKGDE